MATQQHIDKLYRYQVENHRRIVESQDVIEELLRHAIATQNRRQQSALLPLFMFLLGAAAEARMLKILLEPKAFVQGQISMILEQSSQLERWLTLVKIAFLKHKGVVELDKDVTTITVGRSSELLFGDICRHLKDLESGVFGVTRLGAILRPCQGRGFR